MEKLAVAMGADGSDPEVLCSVINVCLVCAGVRSAARLDFPQDLTASFLQKVRSIGRHRGMQVVTWGGHKNEPLFVNTDAVDARDLATVRSCRGSDLEPVVNAAMGRLLGYMCLYPSGTFGESREFVLVALVRRVDYCATTPEIGLQKLQLAGFGCANNMSKRRLASIRAQMMVEWVGPACAALGGCTVPLGKAIYMVVGFDLDLDMAQ